MASTTPSRTPKGFNNLPADNPLRMIPVPDDTYQVSKFSEDFHYWIAARWTITDTGANTQAPANEEWGVLAVTLAAAANNASYIQKKGESFSLEVGRRLWFKGRFNLSDVTDADAVFGLQITDTTPLAASDGIWFSTSNASAALDFHAAKGSVQQDITGIATLVNSTYVEVAVFWNGQDRIEVYVDGNLVGAVTDIATYMSTHTLTASFGHKTTAGTANVMSVDFLTVAEERF